MASLIVYAIILFTLRACGLVPCSAKYVKVTYLTIYNISYGPMFVLIVVKDMFWLEILRYSEIRFL